MPTSAKHLSSPIAMRRTSRTPISRSTIPTFFTVSIRGERISCSATDRSDSSAVLWTDRPTRPYPRSPVAKSRGITDDSGTHSFRGATVRMLLSIVILLGSLLVVGCSREIPTDQLINDLNSDSDGERVIAARLLQNRTKDASKVVPALIKSLDDADGDVRRSAAIGLGYYGAQATDAIPALEEK